MGRGTVWGSDSLILFLTSAVDLHRKRCQVLHVIAMFWPDTRFRAFHFSQFSRLPRECMCVELSVSSSLIFELCFDSLLNTSRCYYLGPQLQMLQMLEIIAGDDAYYMHSIILFKIPALQVTGGN